MMKISMVSCEDNFSFPSFSQQTMERPQVAWDSFAHVLVLIRVANQDINTHDGNVTHFFQKKSQSHKTAVLRVGSVKIESLNF